MTEGTDCFEVYRSKKKSILIFSGSLAFVVLGVLFIFEPEKFGGSSAIGPVYVMIVGLVAALFFGLGIFTGIKRFFQKKPGLILDSFGININPEDFGNRFIEWKIITGFSEMRIGSQRFIMIHINNPEELIEKETNKIRKKLIRFNLNNYGAPFSLTTVDLKITHENLKEELNRYYEKYNQ